MTLDEDLKRLVFLFIVVGIIIVGFGVLMVHDAPIAKEQIDYVTLKYQSKLTANMSGMEKIELAREVCMEAYNDSDYNTRMISGENIYKFDIEQCTLYLIKGNR